MGPRALRGRLQRRQRRRGGRGPGLGGPRHRRRRLDPDPRGQLRPVRAQAPARPRFADARCPALARPERGRRPHPVGGRQRADARRDERPRGRRRARGAATRSVRSPTPPARPPGALRVAVSTLPFVPSRLHAEVRRALDETAELAALAGPRRSPSAIPPTTSSAPSSCRASSRACRRTARRCRARSASRAARAGSCAWDARSTRPPCATRMRDEARQTAPDPPAVRRPRRAAHSRHGPAAGRGPGQWEGMSALRTLAEMSVAYPYTAPWNATGQPAASVPAGFTRRRPAPRGAAGRPATRRGHAVLARRPDRGRAPVGGPPPALLTP